MLKKGVTRATVPWKKIQFKFRQPPARWLRAAAHCLPAQPEADTGAVSKRRHRVPPAQRRDGAARGRSQWHEEPQRLHHR